MTISDVDLIALAFGAFSLLRRASYFPQIVAVARDRHGATAISFSCWAVWVGANASTTLYACVKLADISLALVSAFNAVCCLVVLVLAAYRRTLALSASTVRQISGPAWPNTDTGARGVVAGAPNVRVGS